MGKYSPPKNHNRQRQVLAALCAVLAAVLLLLVAFAAFYESLLGRINRPGDIHTLSPEEMEQFLQQEANQATGTGPTLHEDDIPLDDPAQIIDAGDTLNILLVGQDARPGEKRARSDAMILCTVRKSEGSVTMTSFLRDIYVSIPGLRKGKLNTAYVYGGMELLSATLRENFGVEIHNTVEVDFNGFMEIIDALGGVEISLTAKEAEYLNARGNWGVDDEKNWTLKEGRNTLTGSQALAYSRIRYIGTDFGRTERQRKVLTALVEKSRDMSLSQASRLASSLIGCITTDMSNAQITGYLLEFFPMLKNVKVLTQRIPIDGSYRFSVIKGVGDAIVLDFAQNRAFLLETLGN